jgi:hypothetical protein
VVILNADVAVDAAAAAALNAVGAAAVLDPEVQLLPAVAAVGLRLEVVAAAAQRLEVVQLSSSAQGKRASTSRLSAYVVQAWGAADVRSRCTPTTTPFLSHKRLSITTMVRSLIHDILHEC